MNLNQILADKESRYLLQQALVKQYHCALITVSLNVPGLAKNLPLYDNFFTKVIHELLDFCNQANIKVIKQIFHSGAAGPYLLLGLQKGQNYQDIKQGLITYELSHQVYQIVDFDVFDEEQNKITRAALNFRDRKCYLCLRPAKLCAKQQNHKQTALISYLQTLIKMHDYAIKTTNN